MTYHRGFLVLGLLIIAQELLLRLLAILLPLRYSSSPQSLVNFDSFWVRILG